MSKPKYKVSVANTSVTIDERGYAGTLTFGVGGPIAADYFAKLANEINSLEEQLAACLRANSHRQAKDEALEAARGLIAYRDRIGPLNFQLEKADDFINGIRNALSKATP